MKKQNWGQSVKVRKVQKTCNGWKNQFATREIAENKTWL